MIPVTEALDRLFALVRPLEVEEVPLLAAHGRVLASDVAARRDQPPFAASAMDGYAVVSASVGERLSVIGESAAGHGFGGAVAAGQAVRIFTGAPVPQGATRVVIQEDVTREGGEIVVNEVEPGTNIRPAGTDFLTGTLITAPRVITPNDIALMASMNIARVPVTRRPKVALISTGDELVMPGETPGPDQIIASNTFGLHALLRDLGAEPRLLPIARDNEPSLKSAFGLIDDADLVITIGGASVGDHDLVGAVAQDLGMERAFYKVAMRPGKPLMSGRLGDAMMIGLPGNPVSAMVCGHVFVAPVIRAMLGLGAAPAARLTAPLAEGIAANGPREHYMRARLDAEGITSFERQDSSLLSVLGAANALLIRPVGDPARQAGEVVEYLPL
ncbi:gephyrin-like molybdotransferase Glp [Tropicibacter naphthalenivorans]|uniref:Molybdopterin molybdenumtransferase n=1 Tax=Tropicibacter naphthalenivorans TaxID=441103 RepID=A0A0P1GLK0_9RHOB|nr:gephyrin-like molybdotransferase Glp [Tropicibacter naphthalenivorans]CUH76872.1 Molybdopterin molybdenumtransferase [Tropicibacter naphthalenivorans]SMC62568.1 molybdopterin molybdotransferase [Tropicibacter naphthalenivorans]